MHYALVGPSPIQKQSKKKLTLTLKWIMYLLGLAQFQIVQRKIKVLTGSNPLNFNKANKKKLKGTKTNYFSRSDYKVQWPKTTWAIILFPL